MLCTTDLYKVPDAVPPIHAESYHVATDNGPSIDGGKFRSIFSDNLQPIATHGKKVCGTLLVDKHCRNGSSVKRAPLSVSYYNEISGGHIGRGGGGLFGGGDLPAQYCPCGPNSTQNAMHDWSIANSVDCTSDNLIITW